MNVIPFVQELIRHKKEYGFSKLFEPCHHGFYGMYKGRTCPPEERGQYFFFDKLHPNSLVHCHLSLFLLRQFSKEGFLPADANYRSREEKISTCNRLLSLYQQY